MIDNTGIMSKELTVLKNKRIVPHSADKTT